MKAHKKMILFYLIPIFSHILYLLTRENKALMNLVVNCFTDPVKQVISGLCDLSPISIAEMIYAVLIIGALVLIFLTLKYLFSKAHTGKEKAGRLIKTLLILICAILWIYEGMTLFWGVNFYCDSFLESTGLTDRAVSADELYALSMDYSDHLRELCTQIKRDENGVFDYTTKECIENTGGLIDTAAEEFPYLTGKNHRPKALIFSRILSCIDMTGFYFPFTGEANVNQDSPHVYMPVTTCHELCHQRGVTNEDEANFIAILACTRSEEPSVSYSGYLLGFVYLTNALYKADKDLYGLVIDTLTEQVLTDLAYNRAYWKKLSENKLSNTTQKVSNKVYSSFIESYGEKDVLKKYGACVDLLIDYTCGH